MTITQNTFVILNKYFKSASVVCSREKLTSNVTGKPLMGIKRWSCQAWAYSLEMFVKIIAWGMKKLKNFMERGKMATLKLLGGEGGFCLRFNGAHGNHVRATTVGTSFYRCD
jgi:hypothetical protein